MFFRSGKEEEELAREEVDNRAQQATEKRVIGILMDSTAASGVSKREVFQKLSKRQRNYLDDALGTLMASRRIRKKKGKQDGDWYALR